MKKREICGNFPGGYAMCEVIETCNDGFIKCRAPNGREFFAMAALGTFCEREKPAPAPELTDEMVERAAGAIGSAWDCPEEDDERLRVYARAALNAAIGRE